MDIEALRAAREGAERVCGEAEVEAALDRMAGEMSRRLAGRHPLLLTVMTGGMVPAVWLSTRLDLLHQLDYVHATRYRGATRGGRIRWLARPRLPLAGRSVVVVDDILDEGVTLDAIMDYCREAGATEVLSAVLVRKRHDRAVPGLAPDFLGLEVEDRYVFGCGMDYAEHFRGLRAIYALPGELE